jgi:hypothetical protein
MRAPPIFNTRPSRDRVEMHRNWERKEDNGVAVAVGPPLARAGRLGNACPRHSRLIFPMREMAI